MLKIIERKNSLQMIISSETSLIPSVIRVARDYLAGEYDDQEANMEIVLRELIINAVKHGNNENREKLICITLKSNFGNSIEISVGDEGSGFNLRAIDLKLPADSFRAGHRGLKLVNALSNSLNYDQKINRITARLGDRTEGFLGLGNLLTRTWETA